MTSYDTRSTYSSGAPRPSASTTESNDIKKLKSKYGSSLATLKELFHTWSDEDLLFAIQDAEGDLELTIDRITEGHANQWDQVKTKKSKKETNRSKAAAAVNTSPTSSSSSSYQRDKVNDRSYTTTTRNPSDRAGVKSRSANSNVTSRGSAGQRGAQGTIQSFSHQPTSWKSANHSTTHPATTTTSNNDTLSHASKPSSSNTWASIASIPKHETETSASFSELNNGDGWETGHDRWPSYTLASSETPMPQSKSMHDISAAFTSPTMSSSQSLSTITATPATTKNAAKSWASLLKTKPATEPLQITPESSQTNKQTSSNHQENAPAQDAWTGEAPEESQTTSTEDAWSAPVDVNAAWKSQDTVSWGEEKKDESTDNVAPATHDSEPSFVSEKDPLSAGLTQSFAHEGVPAVVPKDKSTVDGVNIKFGSLSLDESTSASQPPSSASALTHPSTLETSGQESSSSDQREAISSKMGEDILASQENASVNTAAADDATQPPAQQTSQQEQQAYHQQQQQHQPAHDAAMDPLSSVYNSYASYQRMHPEFNMNPMALSSNYGLYGSDTQRPLGSMGYYDFNASAHSLSGMPMGGYQARDKAGQENPLIAGASDPSQALAQQHMFAHPYYQQYYYMGNQYADMYGQPLFNKNMYPMYAAAQQQTATKPSMGSSYTTGTSPYTTQALYGQGSTTANASYEDLLQQRLHGLDDYQRGNYNGGVSMQNLLNSMSSTPRTPSSHPSLPKSLSQQPPSMQTSSEQRLNSSANDSSSFVGSIPQAYPNYFQQQMFSYQQQQQQQQHSQPQHPQQQTYRHPQYWNQ